MIAETYVCSLSNGLIEYGYTFKEAVGVDDSEFDIVLGATQNQAVIEPALEAFHPTIVRILAALNEG